MVGCKNRSKSLVSKYVNEYHPVLEIYKYEYMYQFTKVTEKHKFKPHCHVFSRMLFPNLSC